jgi:hypothetical protein
MKKDKKPQLLEKCCDFKEPNYMYGDLHEPDMEVALSDIYNLLDIINKKLDHVLFP